MNFPACEECGNTYIPHRSTQRFCGFSCCQDWHKRQNRQIRQWWKQKNAEEQQMTEAAE